MQSNTIAKKFIFFCSSKESPTFKIQEIKKKTKKNNLNFLGKKRFCTCNKSKCNKNYCECFSKGEKCNEEVCSCFNCLNKINTNKKIVLKFGLCCSCQKSSCSKKYCECYNSGKTCNTCCSCSDCKNKKMFKTENNGFLAINNLKRIYIRSEKIIIDNYKLKFKN